MSTLNDQQRTYDLHKRAVVAVCRVAARASRSSSSTGHSLAHLAFQEIYNTVAKGLTEAAGVNGRTVESSWTSWWNDRLTQPLHRQYFAELCAANIQGLAK